MRLRGSMRLVSGFVLVSGYSHVRELDYQWLNLTRLQVSFLCLWDQDPCPGVCPESRPQSDLTSPEWPNLTRLQVSILCLSYEDPCPEVCPESPDTLTLWRSHVRGPRGWQSQAQANCQVCGCVRRREPAVLGDEPQQKFLGPRDGSVSPHSNCKRAASGPWLRSLRHCLTRRSRTSRSVCIGQWELMGTQLLRMLEQSFPLRRMQSPCLRRWRAWPASRLKRWCRSKGHVVSCLTVEVVSTNAQRVGVIGERLWLERASAQAFPWNCWDCVPSLAGRFLVICLGESVGRGPMHWYNAANWEAKLCCCVKPTCSRGSLSPRAVGLLYESACVLHPTTETQICWKSSSGT